MKTEHCFCFWHVSCFVAVIEKRGRHKLSSIQIVLNSEIPVIDCKIIEYHLKVALHGGGALVVEVALLCVASPSILKYITIELLLSKYLKCQDFTKYLKYEVEVFEVVVNTVRSRGRLTGINTHRLKNTMLLEE